MTKDLESSCYVEILRGVYPEEIYRRRAQNDMFTLNPSKSPFYEREKVHPLRISG